MSNHKFKVHPTIIIALFRDGRFHRLKDKSGGEYYIDTLDDLLEEDPEILEAEKLFNKNAENPIEDYGLKIGKIMKPYIEEVRKNLAELQKERWIKITSIKFKSIETGYSKKQKYKDVFIPAGPLKTSAMKIKFDWINWEKFFNYISYEGEKNFEWTNLESLFSKKKQEDTLGMIIYTMARYLDKEDELIFHMNHQHLNAIKELRHIRVLKTLKRLDNKGFVFIDSIAVYRTKSKDGRYYFALKTKLSLPEDSLKILESKMKDNKNPKKITQNQISYKNGKLNLNNKEIVISKSKDSNPHYLLKTIFKNPHKIWGYDEIWEDWYSEDEYESSKWSKFYNAGYSTNAKIAQETNVKDFLDLTKTTIKINEKYLKKDTN
ncbi:MAG: hypothetical protein WDZ80_01065 [Candidatus Paceibacterota bacterium]